MITAICIFLFGLEVLMGWGVGITMERNGPNHMPFVQLGRIVLQIFLLVAAIYLWGIRSTI